MPGSRSACSVGLHARATRLNSPHGKAVELEAGPLARLERTRTGLSGNATHPAVLPHNIRWGFGPPYPRFLHLYYRAPELSCCSAGASRTRAWNTLALKQDPFLRDTAPRSSVTDYL